MTEIHIEAPTKRSAARLRAALASFGEASLASVEDAYEISLRSSAKRELLLGQVLVCVSRWARASHLTTARLRIESRPSSVLPAAAGRGAQSRVR